MGIYTIIKGLLPMIFMQVFIYQIQYGGGTRFKKMYGIQKFNDYMRTIPVLTTDNSLQYIWDGD